MSSSTIILFFFLAPTSEIHPRYLIESFSLLKGLHRLDLLQGRHWWQSLVACLGAPCTSYVRYPRTSYTSSIPVCELSLDPEVAILFGREIGQSNDVFYLLIAGIRKDKSRLVTFD